MKEGSYLVPPPQKKPTHNPPQNNNKKQLVYKYLGTLAHPAARSYCSIK